MAPRFLVTGGTGFLGGHLIRQAPGDVELWTTYFRNDPPNQLTQSSAFVHWIRMDLANPRSVGDVVEQARPEVIIHAAAAANVDWCEAHKEETYRINVQGTQHLINLCRKQVVRLLYVSTDMVFDGEDGPYSEEDPPNPKSYYAFTKRKAEEVVRVGLEDSLVVRPALMYGRPAGGGSSFSEWLRSSWEQGRETPLFFDQFRTPIWAEDLARALWELARKPVRGVLHVGGPQRIDRLSFARILAQILKVPSHLLKPIPLAESPFVQTRPRDVSLVSKKAYQLLETPIHDCLTGLEKAYR